MFTGRGILAGAARRPRTSTQVEGIRGHDGRARRLEPGLRRRSTFREPSARPARSGPAGARATPRPAALRPLRPGERRAWAAGPAPRAAVAGIRGRARSGVGRDGRAATRLWRPPAWSAASRGMAARSAAARGDAPRCAAARAGTRSWARERAATAPPPAWAGTDVRRALSPTGKAAARAPARARSDVRRAVPATQKTARRTPTCARSDLQRALSPAGQSTRWPPTGPRRRLRRPVRLRRRPRRSPAGARPAARSSARTGR